MTQLEEISQLDDKQTTNKDYDKSEMMTQLDEISRMTNKPRITTMINQR